MVSTLMILTNLSISSRHPRSDAARRQRESLKKNKKKRSASTAVLVDESHFGSSGKQAIFLPSSVNAMVFSVTSDGRTARRCVNSRSAAVIDFSSGFDRKSNVEMFDMPMARICRAAVERLHRNSSGIGVEGNCSNSSSRRTQEGKDDLSNGCCLTCEHSIACAGALSSSASCPLPGLSLRDLLDLQYFESSLRIERFDLHASAIDHMTNARDGDRRFTDVGRDDHFANIYIGEGDHLRRCSRYRLTFRYLSKDEHLFDGGHIGVERQDDNRFERVRSTGDDLFD